jgi:GNAT superfamily N-acetyltransferase
MLAWAEANLAVAGQDGRRRIELVVQDDDLVRRELLETSGYSMPGHGGWCRSMRLTPATVPLPGEARPPPGYEIRTTRRVDADAGRMAELLNATFGRTIHSQREYLTFMDGSPSFDDHLNLVAVASDGRFGAHVGITLDSVNQHAIVEPVATHPAHRRLGLARLLILEGLARARSAGARTADVETGEAPAANALYEAVGFGDATRFHIWRKDVEPA